MKKISLLIIGLISLSIVNCQTKYPFPLTDLHVHLKGKLTIEDAAKKSAADSVLATFKGYPQFYLAMQAEGREWVNTFSKESREKFDYVFTDCMTFTDEKGRRNRIWMNNETWIDDEQQFMDYMVNTLVKILNSEPVNVYVNATFLPAQMADRYNFFWTTEKMDRVIKAAKDNNIAIEINNRYKIPSAEFIKRGKAAGVKFTIGTNNGDENFSGAGYALAMIKECSLTPDDFYLPVKKVRK
jgi:histidinol phosphatase-like PHP family hydrolase